MADWTLWATFLAVGTGVGLLAIYLLCRARIEQTSNEISILQRELAMSRMREEANERKLAKILEAVGALREANEEQLSHLRAKLDALIAEVSDEKRSAAHNVAYDS